jgi:kynurenine 3-monooxygenase
MVPFYGQGLNCGLEDVRVLDTLLRDENVDSRVAALDPGRDSAFDIRLANALDRYSSGRHEDLVAICDLAMDNLYVSLRLIFSSHTKQYLGHQCRDAPLSNYTRLHFQKNAR